MLYEIEKLCRIFSMHFCEVFLRRHTFLIEGKNTYLGQHKHTLVGCTKPNGGHTWHMVLDISLTNQTTTTSILYYLCAESTAT
jgi:hypothetical protein